MEFVIVNLRTWEAKNSGNCKNIVWELSKKHKILYVNPPLDRATLLKKERMKFSLMRPKKKAEIIEVANNIWVLDPGILIESINWLPQGWMFDFFNRKNNIKFANTIIDAIQKLGFNNVVLFNDNDIFRSFYLKELIKPILYIYYIRDNLTAVKYWKRHGNRLEPELIKKADLVLTNSTYYQKKAANNNVHSYYIGQGCDFSIYNKNQVTLFPDELSNVKRPIIGYVGALSTLRLDIHLLEYLAIQNKNWSIVLIGPEERDFQKSRLHSLDNVFFLGQKKLQDLPNYINAFDVALNPQKVNEITIGNYPRKIDEYLAFGKPVVATRTDAMSIFEEHVYLADNYEEYVQLIQLALQENNEVIENDRIDFARSHVWEKSVNLLYEKINLFSKNETQIG